MDLIIYLISTRLDTKIFDTDFDSVLKLEEEAGKENPSAKDIQDRVTKALACTPHFEIHSENTDFFSYTAEDCKIEDYCNMGKIDFGDIAV